jgi:hypothetical protein
MYTVRSFTNPLAFRAAVEPFLLQAEAVNNLLIGLIGLLTGEHQEIGTPVLRAIYRGDELTGVALRTGDNRALLCSTLPEESIPALLTSLTGVTPVVSRLTCPKQTAEDIAAAAGKNLELRMSLGIYECVAVTAPAAVTGTFRYASPEDLPLLLEWSQGFSRDAFQSTTPWTAADLTAESKRLSGRIAAEKIALWCDPEPVSQVYIAASTPNGARVTGVYTPLELRGRGYASACVARLTDDLLHSGKKSVFLFTDMANPTSNKIYQNIGYRFAGTSVDVDLIS